MTASTGYGLPAPDAGYLRAATADRERAADVLKAAALRHSGPAGG